mgnify:CR=1 FL=1
MGNRKRGISPLATLLILLIISSTGGYIVYNTVLHSSAIAGRDSISIEDVSLTKQTDGGTVFSITIKNTGKRPIKDIKVNLAGTDYSVPLTSNLRSGRTVSFVEANPTPPEGGFISGNKYIVTVVATLPGGNSIAETCAVTCLGSGVQEEKVYAVAFIQTGLPDGIEWSVTFGEEAKFSTESTITFDVKAGMYEWSVQTIEVSDIRYAPSPSSGTLDVPVQTEQEVVFSTQYKLTVFVPDEGGSVTLNPPSDDGFYDAGVNVEVTANPDEGCSFDHWELDGSDVGSENPITVAMNEPHILNAYFTGERWLEGWTLRKSHIIQQAEGAGTNYQVRIIVHYGSGEDSGEDVYLDGKCRTDFGDIRFTDDDGVTLLDYWMEDYVESDHAIFWVEVADDLSVSDATIYIYYGNNDAATISNGADTFIFFEDFDSGLNGWTYYERVGIFNGGLDSSISHSPPNSYKMWENKGGYYSVYCEIRKTLDFDGSTIKVDTQEYHDSNGLTGYFFGKVLIDSTAITSFDLGPQRKQWNYRTSNQITPSSGSHTLKLRFYTNPSSGNLIQLWWDDVRIRKYVDPEPAHGSWGPVEMVNSAPEAEEIQAPAVVRPETYFYLDLIISDANGINDFSHAIVELSNGVKLKWEAATDTFSEIQDVNDYCTLDPTGSFSTVISSTTYKLSWRIKFSTSAPTVYIDVDSFVYDIPGKHEAHHWPSVFYITSEWLEGWQYRKSHEIGGSTAGEVTDYQIRIVVHYGSGEDSDENVYLDGKCRSDFGDLRFTAIDGATELSYWMEEKIGGDYAVFWIKVPDIPASPDKTTIFVYYGNEAAESQSDPSSTLSYWCGFSTDEDWTYHEGASELEGGLYSSIYYSEPSSYRLYRPSYRYVPKYGYCEIRRDFTFDTRVRIIVKEYHNGKQYSGAIYGKIVVNGEDKVVFDTFWNKGQWNDRSLMLESGEYTIGLRWFAGEQFNLGRSGYYCICWDDFAIFKHVDPEPIHGAWGAEETSA